MDHDDAVGLVELAKQKGLTLSSAPCTLFAEAAQTLWKAVREEVVGEVRLVYAEMDDGMVHRMPVEKWVNEAGVVWPYVDEFETGCTIEHAGYVLTWLCAMFGPAESLVAFADEIVPLPEKLERHENASSPLNSVDDFSVLCLRFRGGQVARVTCGILRRPRPRDDRLRRRRGDPRGRSPDRPLAGAGAEVPHDPEEALPLAAVAEAAAGRQEAAEDRVPRRADPRLLPRHRRDLRGHRGGPGADAGPGFCAPRQRDRAGGPERPGATRPRGRCRTR